jgi:hypothetical protein
VLRRIKNIAKFTIRDFIYCHIDSQKLTLEKINFWTKQMKQWPAIFSPKYTRRIEIYPNTFMQIGLVDYLHRCVVIDGVWDEKVRTVENAFPGTVRSPTFQIKCYGQGRAQ